MKPEFSDAFLQWVRDEHPSYSERQVWAFAQGYAQGSGERRAGRTDQRKDGGAR